MTEINHDATFGPYADPVWISFQQHAPGQCSLHTHDSVTPEQLADPDLMLYRLKAGHQAQAKVATDANNDFKVSLAQSVSADTPVAMPTLGMCSATCGGVGGINPNCGPGQSPKCVGTTVTCVDPEPPGN